MAKFRIDNLDALSRQLVYAPREAKLSQLTGAEELLYLIDAGKAYPFELVVFKITGYRPKDIDDALLAGGALQHDLGLFIEQTSDAIDLRTDEVREPVLTIDDVCDKFGVTSKTIQRWRRKGLPGRRFVFPDGHKRVGFLLSSIERFFARHGEQVARAANFSIVTDEQREEIIRRARMLAVECRCCPREIARRIGRKLDRSPLTVLHTIRKFDQDHPSQAILPRAAESLGEEDRQTIIKGYRRGTSIAEMARRLGCTRSAVARAILEQQAVALVRRRVRFIDDALYHQDDAEPAINAIASQEELASPGGADEKRIPRDLPPYLEALYRTPLLSASRERALFLKFNYEKFCFVSARRRLDPQFARRRDLIRLDSLLAQAVATKNQIVQANLRLVVSVARKHLRPGLGLMELISEGNLTLMRAVESFDIHKGYRFSTYAMLALMKGFARSVGAMLSSQPASADAAMQRLPDPCHDAAIERFEQRDQVRHLLGSLDEHERKVLSGHYGLGDQWAEGRLDGHDDVPAIEQTYAQLAQRLGLSRQRVRQIEQGALAKLRAIAHAPGA